MVGLYYENRKSARAAARAFAANHPDRIVHHPYVSDLMKKFRETGSVSNKKHHVERPMRNEAIQVAVLGHVQIDNNTSVRKSGREIGVSKSTVHRILKEQKFHLYIIKLVHELNEDDFDRRLEFCEYYSNLLSDHQNLLYNVCFSDECSFYLHGEINRHNCRYWSDSNPHLYRETYTQNPQKLNVWAGILGNNIVGPFFILLRNDINPRITEILEQDDQLTENELVYQQDGAPPHYTAPVRQFLNETFPGRWIGRRGPVEWPARSPDLTPLDFFLWGHLKTKVYATQPESLEDLRARIVRECRLVTPEMFSNVRRRFQDQLYFCMEVNGGHFQHLVK